MTLKRRNFIQLTTLSVVTVMSGTSLFARAGSSNREPLNTKSLTIKMPTPDGSYAFQIDGRKQVIQISGEEGELTVPTDSCLVEYTAADGVSQIAVYIDQGTTRSVLMPGFPSKVDEVNWDAVLLGNPIIGGKVVATITGPIDTTPVVEITDNAGRTLMTKKLKKSKAIQDYEFDVNRYNKGILLMKVSFEDYTQTLKVLHY